MEAQQWIIYHEIIKDPLLAALCADPDDAEALFTLMRWGERHGIRGNLRLRYGLRLLLGDHLFSRAAAGGTPAGQSILELAEAETVRLFAVLKRFARINDTFTHYVPGQEISVKQAEADLLACFEREDDIGFFSLLRNFYCRWGFGDFAFAPFFRWRGGFEAVADPDLVTMDQLVGCVDQKEALIRNTAAFLNGKRANNALLYGERGTGKSSMVKALGTRFFGDGLRLIELDKSDIVALEEIAAGVQELGLKFIVFIDDLSFENEEMEYKEFKRILEGSLRRQPENLLIYATSNRRHLLKEYWQDRYGEEVNTRESRDEKLSLSSRFGLTVAFLSPDQEEFLAIVRDVAARRGLSLPVEELRREALQWEKWHHGRSGRSAVQFVNDLETRLP